MSCGRFAINDLVEDGPPRNFIEAAERGDDSYIIKAIERTLDFNINQTVRSTCMGGTCSCRACNSSDTTS